MLSLILHSKQLSRRALGDFAPRPSLTLLMDTLADMSLSEPAPCGSGHVLLHCNSWRLQGRFESGSGSPGLAARAHRLQVGKLMWKVVIASLS